MPRGCIALGPVEFKWSIHRRARRRPRPTIEFHEPPYKLHIGPGAGWTPPDEHWLTVDIDPARADICTNFNKDFEGFPLSDASTLAIYASHVLEHVSIYKIRRLLQECYRVLAPGGVFRIVIPNPVASIEHYFKGDVSFPLFARRIARAAKGYGERYTLFEALKEDFISRNGQPELLGENLAHQNAWDFESMRADLERAGFKPQNVILSGFQKSPSDHFAFEGTYPSEANKLDRSLYVEATK